MAISARLDFKRKPGVVLIVDKMMPVDELKEFSKRGADLLELRVDLFSEPIEKILTYLECIKNSVDIPVLGTVRENERTRLHRVELFKAIAPYIDCVDVELGATDSDQIVSAASGKTIMISEHDFEKTPDQNGLEDIVKRSIDQGADIVKIAVMANNQKDVTRLMRFTEDSSKLLVTISMGAMGSISRIAAPIFGSLFTYGFLGEPVAPGQLPVMKLIGELNAYFPFSRGCDQKNDGLGEDSPVD
ncbi:type I 3-dehydroquinate dehydratase [Chitinispirillales bacterium ANBcel5]|uniref:type I 3-dehydroquinate dehydratase n=1 Tax=Cellulosispirillum alkaliphilum TaxID=3039283 RepID=UPI002A55B780|nr:type I 3-dehydroquinate dehydratase [Chitinispirillales bacterium ANBcel5]